MRTGPLRPDQPRHWHRSGEGGIRASRLGHTTRSLAARRGRLQHRAVGIPLRKALRNVAQCALRAIRWSVPAPLPLHTASGTRRRARSASTGCRPATRPVTHWGEYAQGPPPPGPASRKSTRGPFPRGPRRPGQLLQRLPLAGAVTAGAEPASFHATSTAYRLSPFACSIAAEWWRSRRAVFRRSRGRLRGGVREGDPGVARAVLSSHPVTIRRWRADKARWVSRSPFTACSTPPRVSCWRRRTAARRSHRSQGRVATDARCRGRRPRGRTAPRGGSREDWRHPHRAPLPTSPASPTWKDQRQPVPRTPQAIIAPADGLQAGCRGCAPLQPRSAGRCG